MRRHLARRLAQWWVWNVKGRPSAIIHRVGSKHPPWLSDFLRGENVEMSLKQSLELKRSNEDWRSRVPLDDDGSRREHTWGLEGYRQLLYTMWLIQPSLYNTEYCSPRNNSSRWMGYWGLKVFIIVSMWTLNHRLGTSRWPSSSDIMYWYSAFSTHKIAALCPAFKGKLYRWLTGWLQHKSTTKMRWIAAVMAYGKAPSFFFEVNQPVMISRRLFFFPIFRLP